MNLKVKKTKKLDKLNQSNKFINSKKVHSRTGFKSRMNNFKVKLIFITVFILLVPSLVIGYLAATSAQDGVVQQLKDSAKQSVASVNILIDRMIQPKIHDVEHFANQVKGEDASAENERESLLNSFKQYIALHPEVTQIYYGSKKGEFIQYPDSELPSDFDPRKREWYQTAIQGNGKAMINPPHLSVGGNEMVASVSIETKDGAGVIGVDLDLAEFKREVETVQIGKQGYSILLDQNKKYILHPTIKAGQVAKEFFALKMFEGESGEFDYEIDGDNKYLQYTTNKLSGWRLAGTLYYSETDEITNSINRTTGFTALICLVLGGILITFMVRSIVKPIKTLVKQASYISEGDLTQEVHIQSEDEIGQLGKAFQGMQTKLHDLIQEVRTNAEHVASSSNELKLSAEQTSRASEQVSVAVQEIAGGAEKQTVGLELNSNALAEISNGVTLIAERSSAVADLARLSSTQAEDGGKSLRQAGDQMYSIYQSVSVSNETLQILYQRSQEIGEITGAIRSIASQTNLLALNAAIEAARAGEHGSGFAVVADEVRKLAEQSELSAKQISDLITLVQQDTDSAVKTMNKVTSEVEEGLNISGVTLQKLEGTLSGIQETTPQIEEIAATAEEISASVQQITSTANELASIAVGNATICEEVAASAEEQLASMEEISASVQMLSEMASQLRKTIEVFKV
ncbi:methyl-accepting chemotaxis protein [Paenibacillus turicensis]|uniref:Methyl-accepting chemotaxis protein n=1 Tax=Paenibacillus turicensis TaxID=160487 RepID=A0ABS4FS65_9BACL|nr:methyl-accepting chemotaxis protein [Paenibacillus turicensis]MBP1905395.1 methyl-accepting chemotaxis protein [Paenibacillus turicensis]